MIEGLEHISYGCGEVNTCVFEEVALMWTPLHQDRGSQRQSLVWIALIKNCWVDVVLEFHSSRQR